MFWKIAQTPSPPSPPHKQGGGGVNYENPLEFHYFMVVFDEAVEKEIEEPCGKLTRLVKYTTGNVKEMVKNYIKLPPKEDMKLQSRWCISCVEVHTEWLQHITKRSSSSHRSNQEMLKHIRSFITSYLNLRILHKRRHGMFWTLLKLCACYYLNFQVEQKTSGQGGSC